MSSAKPEDDYCNVSDILADFFLKKIDMPSDDSEYKDKSKKKKSKHKKHKRKKSKRKHRSSSLSTNSSILSKSKELIGDLSSSEEMGIKRLKKIKNMKLSADDKDNSLKSSVMLSNIPKAKDTVNKLTTDNSEVYGPSLELLIFGSKFETHLNDETDICKNTKDKTELVQDNLLTCNVTAQNDSNFVSSQNGSSIASNQIHISNQSESHIINGNLNNNDAHKNLNENEITESVKINHGFEKCNEIVINENLEKQTNKKIANYESSLKCSSSVLKKNLRSKKKSHSVSESSSISSHHSGEKRKYSRSHSRSHSRGAPKRYRKRSCSRARSRSHSKFEYSRHGRSRSPYRKGSRPQSRTDLRHRHRSRSRSNLYKNRSSSRSSRSRKSSKSSRHSSSKRFKSRSVSRHRSSSSSKTRGKRKDSCSRSRSRSRNKSRDRSHSKSKDNKSSSHSKNKIDQAKILEIARKNVLTMIKEGTLPEGFNVEIIKKDQLVPMQAGGKSVQELTDFCQRLSEKEHEPVEETQKDDNSEEDSGFIHHPFKVKELSTIKMNIKNATQLPLKTPAQKVAETTRLSSQFPVSSGNQHKQKELEWIPVEPKKTEVETQTTTVVSTSNDVSASVLETTIVVDGENIPVPPSLPLPQTPVLPLPPAPPENQKSVPSVTQTPALPCPVQPLPPPPHQPQLQMQVQHIQQCVPMHQNVHISLQVPPMPSTSVFKPPKVTESIK